MRDALVLEIPTVGESLGGSGGLESPDLECHLRSAMLRQVPIEDPGAL